MALTLKDIAAGNKRLGTISETASYRAGSSSASKSIPASEIQSLINSQTEVKDTNKSLLNSQNKLITNINKLCSVLEKSIKIGSLGGSSNQLSGVKVTPGSNMTENELEAQKVTQDMASDIAYLPRIFDAINSLGKSIKDLQKAVEKIDVGGDDGGFLPWLSDFGGKGKGKGAAKKGAAKKGATRAAAKKGILTKLLSNSPLGILGKRGSKLVPGIGIAMGLGFAADRYSKGDKTGAGMELVSGAASTVPGYGTAASIGIDAALAAKDIKAEQDTTAPKIEPKSANTTTKTYSATITSDPKEHPNYKKYLDEELNKAKTPLSKDAAYEKARMRTLGDMVKEQNGVDTSTPKVEPKKPEGVWSKIKSFFSGNKNSDQQKLSDQIDRDFDDQDKITPKEAQKFAGSFAKGGEISSGEVGVAGETGPELISGPANVLSQTSTEKLVAALDAMREKRGIRFGENDFEWTVNMQNSRTKDLDKRTKGIPDLNYEDYKKVEEELRKRPEYADIQRAKDEMMKGEDQPTNQNINKAKIDSADRLLSSSSETEMAKNSKDKTGNVNNVVNAPTNITKQTQHNYIKTPIRAQDPTIKQYYGSKFAS